MLTLAFELLGLAVALAATRGPGPFADFRLPQEWQEQFWADPSTTKLLELEPSALAAWVPVQAGFRFVRCPACGGDETLTWTPAQRDALKCRACDKEYPDLSQPPKVPPLPNTGVEAIEVRPGVVHKYPYVLVDPARQRLTDERSYLAAKRDDAVRAYLAQAALYAAVRHRDQAAAASDTAPARLACVLLLRFAQVYPNYATRCDQPGQPPLLLPATLAPPYRRGYGLCRWDWSGALGIPLNLVIAYALVRESPALAEAGRALGDPEPARTIERDLFRAAARFVRDQPEEYTEAALHAYRGLLAVGRLLDDAALVQDAAARLERFFERGFSHDGLWCQADARAQRRIVHLLDGWFARLLPGFPQGPRALLARRAEAAFLGAPAAVEVEQAAWPPITRRPRARKPMLLGGSGLARLAVGSGPDAVDVELRGFGNAGSPRSQRLAVRVAVGGRTVLGDLDDAPPRPDGFDLSSASHNTVLVDGLNHRESLPLARRSAPGADVVCFAADPDFQVAALEDRHAYPQTATRFRQWIVAAAGARSRYAVSVFEVEGGLQHDQLWHAAADTAAGFRLPGVPLRPGPSTLLPPALRFLPDAPAETGRWFVQALGMFTRLSEAQLDRFTVADLNAADTGVRLHLLGDLPAQVITGEAAARAALVVRRGSRDGATLTTTFVTLIEPRGTTTPPLVRVGRVASPPGTVVLTVQTDEGPEHLVFNLRAPTAQTVLLADGRRLTTDGVAVRLLPGAVVLAGGETVALGEQTYRQPRAAGELLGVGQDGSFLTGSPLADPETLSGRTLRIRHGDGTTRGWTIETVTDLAGRNARIRTTEPAGFTIDPHTGTAQDERFPGRRYPGPHRFAVDRLSRWTLTSPH